MPQSKRMLDTIKFSDSVKIWISENLARSWFEDALHEARNGTDYNFIRREIIFSVCFAETYLYEWTRTIVGVNNIPKYFPRNYYNKQHKLLKDLKTILAKNWRLIPNKLYQEGLIRCDPNLDVLMLDVLVTIRNGYIHAHASRPLTDSQPQEEKPVPIRSEIEKLGQGWALQIVLDLIFDLHNKLGTTHDAYIVKP